MAYDARYEDVLVTPTRCANLVWPVNCTLGHVEIAGFDVTVYVDATTGELLGVRVPSTEAR